jgi:hypothetical protein
MFLIIKISNPLDEYEVLINTDHILFVNVENSSLIVAYTPTNGHKFNFTDEIYAIQGYENFINALNGYDSLDPSFTIQIVGKRND